MAQLPHKSHTNGVALKFFNLINTLNIQVTNFFFIETFLNFLLDVWAFGVTLWELFSAGAPPYMAMSNMEASDKVIAGYRLPKPPTCPDELFEVMKKCWNSTPESSPSMRDLFEVIDGLWYKNRDPERARYSMMPHRQNNSNVGNIVYQN